MHVTVLSAIVSLGCRVDGSSPEIHIPELRLELSLIYEPTHIVILSCINIMV